jgi:5'-phosphate synthase pdxT subunit
MLESLGLTALRVRLPEELADIQGLILPGGESTTLMALLNRWKLTTPLKGLAKEGLPILGTCAGAVLLSSSVSEREHEIEQESLQLADVEVIRNRFGKQTCSFSELLSVKGLSSLFQGIFIRAPLLLPTSRRALVLAEVDEGPVFLRQDNLWLTSFHPELTTDNRIHRMFITESGIASSI